MEAFGMFYLALIAAAFMPFGFVFGRSMAQRSCRPITPMLRTLR